MLNVNTIKNGLVIDHIRAGSGWKIYQWLGLDKAYGLLQTGGDAVRSPF